MNNTAPAINTKYIDTADDGSKEPVCRALKKEADPAATEDPGASNETGKSKLFLVVILFAALRGCGFWLAKKLKKKGDGKGQKYS